MTKLFITLGPSTLNKKFLSSINSKYIKLLRINLSHTKINELTGIVLFIRKYSYKSGIILGLILYASGAFLFYPAAILEEYNFFLLSLWVITCGLAFLETTAIIAYKQPVTRGDIEEIEASKRENKGDKHKRGERR